MAKDTGAPDMGMSLLAGVRRLARTVTDAGFLSELKGEPDAGAEWYLGCLRFGAQTRRSPSMMSSLVGASVGALGQQSLDSLVANEQLSEEMLRRIIASCRDAEIQPGEMAAVWAGEMAFAEYLMQARKQAAPQNALEDATRKAHALIREVLATRTLDELLQRSTAKTVRERLDAELKPYGNVIDADSYLGWFARLGRVQVALRGSGLRAAIALHQRRHAAALPESLDALSPEILPAAPIDPYSGKPMRYAKTADGWKLWSVGDDNVDNGGIVANPALPWGGPDFVFDAKVRSNLEGRTGKRTGSVLQPADPAARATAPASTLGGIPTPEAAARTLGLMPPVGVAKVDYYEDGGTTGIQLTDAEGQSLLLCLDGRMDAPDPRHVLAGAMYPTRTAAHHD
jgi:hypothetical protein